MNFLIVIGRFFVVFFTLFSLQSYAQSKRLYVPNEFVVSFDKNKTLSTAVFSKALSKGFRFKKNVNSREGIFNVHYSDSTLSLKEKLALVKKELPNALVVEPNYLYYANFGSKPPPTTTIPPPIDDGRPSVTPNDSFFSNLWGMRNIGQADPSGQKGVANADNSAAKAWVKQTSAANVIVAIIDTGVDYTHPDLADNMWQGRDSQGNIIHGYNAIKENFDPMDDNSHGTHVAGTIGAVGNNNLGVAGVTWKTQIMAVKFLDSRGSGSLADAVQAIDFATEHGADVMNNSWGSSGSISSTLKAAVERALQAGVVFVAAAGNDGNSNDGNTSKTNYPASFDLDNVVSVAASDNTDKMANFSNYGKTSVHLMAPGVNIYSSVPGGKYASYSGTSMATPHVTGAVALLLQRNPNLKPLEVRERLMRSSDKISVYSSKLISSGRLNVYNLIENLQGSSR